MGCYDMFFRDSKDTNDYGIQLKAGECLMHCFTIGSNVGESFADGAYIGYEGVVVVEKGIVTAISHRIFNKWGGEINPSEILDKQSPIVEAMNRAKAEVEAEKNGK